jgi:hypothetical protein
MDPGVSLLPLPGVDQCNTASGGCLFHYGVGDIGLTLALKLCLNDVQRLQVGVRQQDFGQTVCGVALGLSPGLARREAHRLYSTSATFLVGKEWYSESRKAARFCDQVSLPRILASTHGVLLPAS